MPNAPDFFPPTHPREDFQTISASYRKQRWIWFVLVVGLLATATFLRFHHLGKKSLWEDELFSADLVLNRALLPKDGEALLDRVALRDLGTNESFWTAKAADQSPPLYELLNKLTVQLWGDSEAGLRALGAVSTLCFLAWMGFRAHRYRQMPLGFTYLVVIVMCTFSAAMVFYAQEARAYSLGAAFCSVLIILFWERLLSGWQKARMPGWLEIAVFIAAALTHYVGMALVALLLACYGIEALRRRDWSAILRMTCVLLAVLSWLLVSFPSIVMASKGQYGWVPKISYKEAIFLSLQGIYRDMLGESSSITMGVTSAIALLMALCMRREHGGIALSRRGPPQPASSWAFALLALGALMIFYFLVIVFITRKSQIHHPRHYIFLLPVLYVFFAAVLAKIWTRVPWLGWCILVFTVLTQLQPLQRSYSIPKSDFRGASAFVRQHLRDGDALLLSPILNPGSYLYYLNRNTPPKLSLHFYYRPEEAQQICETMRPYARFAAVYHASHKVLADALKKICSQGYAVSEIELHQAGATVWERTP